MKPERRARPVLFIGAGLGLSFLAFVCSLALGPATAILLKSDIGLLRDIILEQRLARSLLAWSVGALLGLSGTALQGLFQNRLADPYITGTSAGAAFGAALALVFGVGGVGVLSGPSLFALLGSLGASLLVFSLARTAGRAAPLSALLLSGTAVSALFSSLLSLLLVIQDRHLHRVYFWLLGGFAAVWYEDLYIVLAFGLLSLLCLLPMARSLDILASGEDSARSLGLSLFWTRLLILLGSSFAVAAAVSVAGIIGFVGLIAPHIARLLLGPRHRWLFPLAATLAGLITLLADMLARSLIAPVELPLGILTSLIGAPFFLWLLVRAYRRGGAVL